MGLIQVVRVPKEPVWIATPAPPAGYAQAASGLYVPEDMIVQGAFSALFTPGLVTLSRFVTDWERTLYEIERVDDMALLNPDTSKVPIWRRRPTRREGPITAWRAWRLNYFPRGSNTPCSITPNTLKLGGSWKLSSAAISCDWEGPVIRAHKRPVDPKYWDAKKDDKQKDPNKYYEEMDDTFHNAGIWAVKTEQFVVEEVLPAYSACVYGQVALWGRVAQFTDGYRAEACMIKRLFVVKRLFDIEFSRPGIPEDLFSQCVAELSRRYGCDVEIV